MAQIRDVGSDRLNSIPTEMRDKVIRALPSKDILNLKLLNREWYHIVTNKNSRCWRYLVLKTFDLAPQFISTSNEKLMEIMIHRCQLVVRATGIKTVGMRPCEREVLAFLKDLINEANGGVGPEEKGSNIDTIAVMFFKEGGLSNLFNFDAARLVKRLRNQPMNPTPLYCAVQVMLTPLHLDARSNPRRIFHYWDSVDAVFRPRARIFVRPQSGHIDMILLAHVVNFYKFHLLKSDLGELSPLYARLSSHDRPQMWNSHLGAGGRDALDGSWKISFGCRVEGNPLLTARMGPETTFQELEAGYSNFPEVGLDFPGALPSNRELKKIAKRFSTFLVPDAIPAYPAPAQTHHKGSPSNEGQFPLLDTESSHETAQFFKAQSPPETLAITQGYGGMGWTKDLPIQHGIPGWKRFTMVRYDYNQDWFEGSPPDELVGHRNFWLLLDGVVLPGGKIIMGSWWHIDDGQEYGAHKNCGPFLMWKSPSAD